jgi:hypothetical protein
VNERLEANMSNTNIEPTVDTNIDILNRVKFELERFQHKTRWVFQLDDLQADMAALSADILCISERFEGLIGAVHAVKKTRGLASPEAKRLAESLYGEINNFRIMTKGARRALKAASQLAAAVEDLSNALSERGSGLVRAKREWLALRDAGKQSK